MDVGQYFQQSYGRVFGKIHNALTASRRVPATVRFFSTYAFQIGIQSGDIPLGAADSLFMFPILAFAAFFVLRGVTKRTKEIAT